jgi:uncharacterized protein YlxW (UPF0749 family)
LKRVSIFIAILLITIGAGPQSASLAQQKKPQQKKPARGAKSATSTPDMRAEAALVAAQIKNVSNFIFIYGKIVNGLEVADEQTKNNLTSPETQADIRKAKDKLIAKIRDLRAGLEELANNVRPNSRLQVQYLKLSYANEAALDVERFAVAERYEEAGRSLVAVVERLTDAIISMRLP